MTQFFQVAHFIVLFLFLSACNPKIASVNYYNNNKEQLDSIESVFKNLNTKKPFAMAFVDRRFNILSMELISDSLTRIFEFRISKTDMADTLQKYGYDAERISNIVGNMKLANVTWINNFDYYENDQQNQLIYLSIRPAKFLTPYTYPKYITLVYFGDDQFFDEKGRLLDGKGSTQLRKMNENVFYRITDRICFAIAEKFR